MNPNIIISSTDAGSDYQQTDVDDQHSTVTELNGRKCQGTADQGNHILVSGQAEFTPMFIIKNVFSKQVRLTERIEIDWKMGTVRLCNINFSN